jgi:ATP-dependent Lhr-like helicase
MDDVFSNLSKPMRMAIHERGFHEPTEPQIAAIPLILEGKNVLLMAPTGTGKTEAAFLPILNQLILMADRRPGIKILYITPLRALNRDLLGRLSWWCRKLDLKVAVRHGDTDTTERSRQALSPPDLLITTPETLQAILVGRRIGRHLEAIRWVIIDEIHELASDKRGSQLSIALERLRGITGKDFQLIGLSATIGTPERVAQFLVGVDRPYDIVRVPVARYMKLDVQYPEPKEEDLELASRLYTHADVAARLRVMKRLIEEHNSVLLFTNTRSIAEVLASRFKVWDVKFPISIHHGSLAKSSRIATEDDLKSGKLKGIVCTSSLELGIDVGRIDLCIQYNSPRQVTRLLQRVGRSGHKIGHKAEGVIITMDSDDTLEALVISRRALREELEPLTMPECPFDVLAHQVAGLLIQKRSWTFDEALRIFRRAYPFRGLSEDELAKVLDYMHSRYPRLAWSSRGDRVFMRPSVTKDLYNYYFENMSMIPEEKHYLVIDEESDQPVGVLDEAFISEYGEPGTKFIVRGAPWKVLHVYGDKIYVRAVDDPTGAIPSWVGEEIPVPSEIALEVGCIRGDAAEKLQEGSTLKEVSRFFADTYMFPAETFERGLSEVREQVERQLPSPTDKRITVEPWENYIIVQCSAGTLVNRTLSRLLGFVLSEKTGLAVGVQQDPYRIVIRGDEFTPTDVKNAFMELTRADIKEIALKSLTNTGLFKRRLINVARKFGAISKEVDASNVNLGQIISSLEGSAILDETRKDLLANDLDIDSARSVLNEIAEGRISIEILETHGQLSPLARIGIEEIGRKTDLIPPEKMRRIIIESTKVRLLDEVRTLICVENYDYADTVRLFDVPTTLKCPECGSPRIASLPESLEDLKSLLNRKGNVSSERDKSLLERARRSAELVEKFGKVAVVVLAGRGIDADEAASILAEESSFGDRLFELINEAEKRSLRRYFW